MADLNNVLLELRTTPDDPLGQALAELRSTDSPPAPAPTSPAPADPSLVQRLVGGAREAVLSPVKLTGALANEAGKTLLGLGHMAAWGARFLAAQSDLGAQVGVSLATGAPMPPN